MFNKNEICIYEELINGKLLNSFPIQFVSFEQDVYRFKAFDDKSKHYLNFHKDCVPKHKWRSDRELIRETEIVRMK